MSHEEFGSRSQSAWKVPPPPATPLNIIETEPMRVLMECIETLKKKGSDYQNPKSTIRQADYYESGVKTILEIIQAKRLRLKSLVEAFEHGDTDPNFESIEDSFKDMANYCAIGAAWCRGKIVGQDQEKDILNRPKQKSLSLGDDSPYGDT